ncbi:MAG TPA: patatin-like phospholipase family protein [Caldimonas sp.]|jgi:NTE family protein|nr:patatin-like phospholipase family protein [Caldimonas sp.]HEX2542557.1 patatin-like phospholipase family protein [Caldimonas sp.]
MQSRHKEEVPPGESGWPTRRDVLRTLIAGWGAAGGALALGGCASRPPTGPAAAPAATLPTPSPAPPAPPAPPRRPRIGLALGGGAARGFAHIGVIQALEENGLVPDLVVGTSAGSLVAALYASGKGGRELASIADAMDETAFADWSYPGRGLIRGEALAKFVREKTNRRNIEQMRMPLGIAATDLDSGAAILFRSGDTGTAVRASSAVPAVFQPVKIGKREYVDGGLTAPIPVHHARQMGAEFVIAVDISAVPEGNPTGDAARMLMQTFAIMGRGLKNHELREADVVVQPALAAVAGTDFSTRRQSIRAGREAALAQLIELRARLAAKTH